MTCCRCTAGGKCRNCVCVKSKRQYSNCLPSCKGCCSNTKLSSFTQGPVTANVPSASPAHSGPPSPCANESRAAITAFSPDVHNPAIRYTTQEPAENSLPLINDHPTSPAILTPIEPLCPLPSPSPMPIPSFKWGEHDSTTVMQSLDEAYSEVVHWQTIFSRSP